MLFRSRLACLLVVLLVIGLLVAIPGCPNSELAEAESHVADLESQVQELESQVADLGSQVETLKSGISDVRVYYDDLSRRIDRLGSEARRFDGEDWQYVVGDVRDGISRVRRAADDLDSSISGVE